MSCYCCCCMRQVRHSKLIMNFLSCQIWSSLKIKINLRFCIPFDPLVHTLVVWPWGFSFNKGSGWWADALLQPQLSHFGLGSPGGLPPRPPTMLAVIRLLWIYWQHRVRQSLQLIEKLILEMASSWAELILRLFFKWAQYEAMAKQ